MSGCFTGFAPNCVDHTNVGRGRAAEDLIGKGGSNKGNTLMRKKSVVLLAATLAAFSLPDAAHAWEHLGSRVVNDKAEVDVIRLPGPRRYKQIRLCVGRHPVRFHDVDVRFANGGHQDIKIASRINPGRCTRAIDLKGGRRDIALVRFYYEETSVRLRRASVSVFGR
jgi:hypothetical protein